MSGRASGRLFRGLGSSTDGATCSRRGEAHPRVPGTRSWTPRANNARVSTSSRPLTSDARASRRARVRQHRLLVRTRATAPCSSTYGSHEPATGPHPLIIWIHGGGWIYGSRRRLPPHLFDNAIHDQMLDAGYAVAAVDYRLAREAGFPGMLLDIKAAVRWLRGHAGEFDLDPRPRGLLGRVRGRSPRR